ncbi:hypothetical protein SAMN02927903_00424 [Flavobacterium caeni]|uniref:YD repeat-containing protein n=2 Tax=Flavobacterium caeni TaxID=490189 RepID=A0A1G5BMZ7_9FLAO|nr:hypothetical protein SAMN02927903_00424 [Flavobacterium caeni]
MKSLKNTIALIALLLSPIAFAQTATTKNVSGQLIDPQTNCILRYYYFPNLEAYYDTQKNEYWYTENGQWIVADEIPEGYRGYSLYNKVNVVIHDYDDDDPTQFLSRHKKKYPYITKNNIKKLTASIE